MLALALPVLVEEALNLMVGWTNWWLAGRFIGGDEPLAAMGLLAYIMWLIPSLFSFVGIGATAFVADISVVRREPAVIVVNTSTGAARRVLSGHPALSAQPSTMMLTGRSWRCRAL